MQCLFNNNSDNNNKRELPINTSDSDKDEGDTGDNKKQKLDNNNSNGNSETDKIDINNLEKKTIVKLKVIADSIGLSIKSGSKKGDIIHQIKSILKRKQKLLVLQEIDKNINSFNKSVIEFTIKDGVDDSEWLFWKVFRNKFIYKRIMSNMDTHLSIPYDSIHSVAKMIDNDQLEILRDKVIRNQYLTFYVIYELSFEKIFVVIKKDNDQDLLFYQRLFKYYGQYSLDFSNADVVDQTIVDKKTGREELVNRIIDKGCLPALRVLIQDYNYNPTIGNYKLAIQLGKLKFIKLLSQPQFKLSENYNPVPPLPHEDNTNYYSFKSIYHFENENVNDFDSSDESILDRLMYFDMVINRDSKLKRLIQICVVISRSTKSIVDEQLFSNANEIETLTSILTNQELKLSITNNQFHSGEGSSPSSPKREIIKKLLDYYYHYSMIKKPNFYFNYFNSGDLQLYGKMDFNVLDFKMAFEFANFEVLKSFKQEPNEFTDNHKVDFLFSNCLDKSKHMEFINQVIESIKLHKYIDATLFFYLVIGNDNLDQIKHVSKKLTPELIVVQQCHPYLITRYIKSKLVLDWLFENHLNHFTDHR